MKKFYFLILFFTSFLSIAQDCEINTINPDFELPVIPQNNNPTFEDQANVPGWNTTATDGIIEMWPSTTSGGGVIAYSGVQYIELNAHEQAGVYQDYNTPLAGIEFSYTFAHAARNLVNSGFDVVAVYAGPPEGTLVELGQYSSEVWTGWHVYSGTYTVPAGQIVTRFEFRAISTAYGDIYGDDSVGNFLDAIEFTSNFGLASTSELDLACENNIATGIQTLGIGFWTIDPTNPSPTTINNLGGSNYSIEGFVLSGDYRYIWTNDYCDEELIVHYSNEQIAILNPELSKYICSNEMPVNLVDYQPEISIDADSFRFYENEMDALAGNGNFIIDPSNYSFSGTEILYVRLEKSGHCTDVTELHLNSIEVPAQNEITEQAPFCDEDGDGELIVDLTSYQDLYIVGSTVGLDFHFYQDALLTIPIPNAEWSNYAITTFPHSVWILAEITENGVICRTIPEEIQFVLKPELPVNQEEYVLPGSVFCVEEGESINLDLTILESDITNLNANFTYYESEAQALAGGTDFIPNPSNYQPANSGSVYVRIEEENYCFAVVRIDFQIGNFPNFTEISSPISKCDEDFDGIIPFDLDLEAVPLLNIDIGTSITYYETELDAQNGTNPLPNGILNIPAGTGALSYWAVLSNENCESIVEIPLFASEGLDGLEESIPVIYVCDDDFDGVRTVDLTQAAESFLPNTNGITISYFLDENLTSPIPNSEVNNYELFGTTTEIWIHFEIGECEAIRAFLIEFRDTVQFTSTPNFMEGDCGNEILDLTWIEEEILPQDTDFEFSYYLTLEDLIQQINPINTPENYTPEVNSGEIFVRVDKNQFCPNYFIVEFSRRDLPENPFDELPTLCSGTEFVLNAGQEYPDENYEWNWAGGSHIGSELVISEPGIYNLTITTEDGCSETFELEIAQPELPVITNITVGPDYIIVEASGNNSELEYSLDGIFWQLNPRFNNLNPGEEYTVYVRNFGCTPVSEKITILYITNFLSPNNDGKNDTWEIRGLTNSYECSVKIFDRYGKIFVDSGFQIFNEFSWNGKYKGESVPSGDYWYIITTRSEDKGEFKYLGHISVRNRD